MNAALFGMLSLGLMLSAFSADSRQLDVALQAAADDAEVARLMEAAPDQGFMGATVHTDPATGEETQVDLLAFKD